MKKIFTIGRDIQCDIIISDNTDVVSRCHAILEETSHGKYCITDQSRNGTYVNGIKIAPNELVPVTRKDSISFAHVCDLDWSRVPKDYTAVYVISAIVAVVVVAAVLLVVFKYTSTDKPEEYVSLPVNNMEQNVDFGIGDGIPEENADNDKAEEQENSDSDKKDNDKKDADKSKKQEGKKDNKKTAANAVDVNAVIDAIY